MKPPYLLGNWRHSEGFIFCGTLRVAKTDFDTNPTPEFQKRLLDDLCDTMNSNINKFQEAGLSVHNHDEMS